MIGINFSIKTFSKQAKIMNFITGRLCTTLNFFIIFYYCYKSSVLLL